MKYSEDDFQYEEYQGIQYVLYTAHIPPEGEEQIGYSCSRNSKERATEALVNLLKKDGKYEDKHKNSSTQ